MKKIIQNLIPIAVLLILGLLLTSCGDLEFGPPSLYYLCHADSTGLLHRTDLPVDASSFIGMERLKDGRALIISNKLHLWNPYTDAMTDITPTGFVSERGLSNVACSSDGQFIYYSAGGKIQRKSLLDNSVVTLVDSLNSIFFDPVISLDDRYLNFIKATKDAYNNLNYEGYPLFLNLISGEVMSLHQTGLVASTALIDSYQERFYYVLYSSLYTMDMDGSHRSLVFSNFGKARLSGDGNFLVNSFYYYDATNYVQYYRDNRTMGWRYFEASGPNGLARNANLLYYSKLKRLYALNLDSGTSSTILPSVIFGHEVLSVLGIAPAWDGKDLVCVVRLLDEE